MKKIIGDFCILICIAFVAAGLTLGQNRAKVKTINGVPHVLNPAKPLKGIVSLEIEKILEIDPYKIDDVGMRMILFARDDDGSVVLYDPNSVEARRFNEKGEHLGLLFRKGQGPGEFWQGAGVNIFFSHNQIWAFNMVKLAKFDKDGRFLEEKKLGSWPAILVSDDLCFKRVRFQDTEKIVLTSLDSGKENSAAAIMFFQAKKVGVHRSPDGERGFASILVIPEINIAYNPNRQIFYGALNTEYKIHAKNLKGETVFVIEKPHKKIKLSRKDKEQILYVRDASDNWKFDACPDYLVAISELAVLPNDYLAVGHFTSIKEREIDIFDPRGEYVYVLKLPARMRLDRTEFFRGGIATGMESKEGYLYAEFKVKNLPEIFR
jgi:hypothetical protein